MYCNKNISYNSNHNQQLLWLATLDFAYDFSDRLFMVEQPEAEDVSVSKLYLLMHHN